MIVDEVTETLQTGHLPKVTQLVRIGPGWDPRKTGFRVQGPN